MASYWTICLEQPPQHPAVLLSRLYLESKDTQAAIHECRTRLLNGAYPNDKCEPSANVGARARVGVFLWSAHTHVALKLNGDGVECLQHPRVQVHRCRLVHVAQHHQRGSCGRRVGRGRWKVGEPSVANGGCKLGCDLSHGRLRADAVVDHLPLRDALGGIHAGWRICGAERAEQARGCDGCAPCTPQPQPHARGYQRRSDGWIIRAAAQCSRGLES